MSCLPKVLACSCLLLEAEKALRGSPTGKVLLCVSVCPIYSQVIAAMLNKIVAAMTVSVSNPANQC